MGVAGGNGVTATGLYALTGVDLGRAATVADLQAMALAGIDFLGNQADNTTNRLHTNLGSVVKIEGKSGATYGSGDYAAANYSADNLITYKDGDALRIAMKTKPTFEALTLQPSGEGALPVTLTPSKTTDNKPVVTLSSGTDPVEIKGVAKGTAADSAVNKSQLDAVANAVGLNGTNGINGVDGIQGPGGQDGLNGQSLANKVQALRDGLAGTVVYTDETGTRLISEDGQYYYREDLVKNTDGSAKFVKANDGLWYAPNQVNADGTLANGVTSADGKKLSALDGATNKKIDANKVILSTVNADGSTTNPIKLSNLVSVLGAIPTTATTDAAKFTDAQNRVANLLAGKDSADTTKPLDLERAATAADLQVLAQAGLSFQGNDEAKVNRALSQTLTIKGEGIDKTAAGTFQSAAGNIAVAKDSDSALVVKLAKNLVAVESIGKGAVGNAQSARISFTDAASSTNKPQISMNNAKVTGVAAGGISASSTDAINGSQLNTSLGSIKSVLGASFTNSNGSITAPADIAGTGANTIEGALTALKAKAVDGVIKFKGELSGTTTADKKLGDTIEFTTLDSSNDTTFKGANIATAIKDGKVNIAIKQVASADDVKGTLPTDGTGGGLVTAEVLKNYVTDQVGNGKLGYKAAGETPARSVALSTGLTFNGDDNLTPSTKADTGDVTYALNSVLKNITSIGSGKNVANETEARLSFHSATAGTTPTEAYIEANGVKLTGLAKASLEEDSTDAVTGGQLKEVKDQIDTITTNVSAASVAYKTTANGATTSTDGGKVNLGTGFNFTSTSDNLTVDIGTKNSGVVKFGLKDTLTGITSISGPKGSTTPLLMTLGDGTLTFSGSGTKNGAQLKGVLKGGADTDAVNMSQLKAVAGSIGATVGTDGSVTGPTFDTAVKGGSSGDNDKPSSTKDAIDDLITAVNKGIVFSDGSKTTTKQLGDTLQIKSGALTKTDYVADNLLTEVKDGNVLIGFKKAPTFTELALQASSTAPKISIKPSTDSTKPSLTLGSGTTGTDPVQLKGIADGTDGSDAVTVTQLNKVRDAIGLPADGKDGVNGIDGAVGADGRPAIGQPGVPGKDGQGLVGPAGKDGLNGTSTVNKVQALRDGVAGTVVYTDTAGNRLVAENGNYYDAKVVDNLAKAKDGLWYNKDLVNDDGSLKAGAAGTGKTLEQAAATSGIANALKDPSEVILSAVNADGKTTSPVTIANLKDNLAGVTPTEAEVNQALSNLGLNPADVTPEQKASVKSKLAGKKASTEVASLLGVTDAKQLSRAVTLHDLQTVAQAGLTFMGNDNTAVHRALGTTFKILGADLAYTRDAKPATGADATKAYKADYAADNLITHADDDDTVRIEMKKTPTFDGIVLDGKPGTDGQGGKDGYIGVDANGNVVVKNGTDGIKGADGKDGADGASRVITEKDINGTGNAGVKLSYKAGSESTANTTTLKEGLIFKGDDNDNIKTSTETGGVVNVKLNDKLTGIDTIGGKADEGSLDFGSRDTVKKDSDGNVVYKKDADGNFVLDSDGNKIPETIKEKTIDAGGAVITNIGTPTKDSDAANKGYVDTKVTNLTNTVNQGFNIATEGAKTSGVSSQQVKPTDTVKVKDGVNTTVSKVKNESSGVFSYTINVNGIPMSYINSDGETLAKVGDKFFVVTNTGEIDQSKTNTKIAGMKVVTPEDSNMTPEAKAKGLTIDNVGNGKVAENSKQAVNGGQIANILGIKSIDENGKVTGKDGTDGIGGTGKDTVNDAITKVYDIAKAKASNVTVKAGDNITVDEDIDSATQAKTYTVSMSKNIKLDSIQVGGVTINNQDTAQDPSIRDGANVLNVNGSGNSKGTVITGVADGQLPTDAVNVRQVNALANATNKAINNVNKRVDNLTKESRGGIAGAMATAGLQQTTQPGRTTVSVGTATFKGESAVALGFSKLSDSGKVGIRISGMTTSNGDTGGSFSVGYTW